RLPRRAPDLQLGGQPRPLRRQPLEPLVAVMGAFDQGAGFFEGGGKLPDEHLFVPHRHRQDHIRPLHQFGGHRPGAHPVRRHAHFRQNGGGMLRYGHPGKGRASRGPDLHRKPPSGGGGSQNAFRHRAAARVPGADKQHAHRHVPLSLSIPFRCRPRTESLFVPAARALPPSYNRRETRFNPGDRPRRELAAHQNKMFSPNASRIAPPSASPYPPAYRPTRRPAARPRTDIRPPAMPNVRTVNRRWRTNSPRVMPTEKESMLTERAKKRRATAPLISSGAGAASPRTAARIMWLPRRTSRPPPKAIATSPRTALTNCPAAMPSSGMMTWNTAMTALICK